MSVQELRERDFSVASVPCYTHAEWTDYAQPIPKDVLCITMGRLNVGQAECFIGNGINKYSDLNKFGAQPGGGTGIYSADISYMAGDVVVYSGFFWNCIKSGKGQTPASGSTYWTAIPLYTPVYEAGGTGEPV